MDSPDIMKQPMPGGGVNKPGSGTYGEKADLDRLNQQLPPMAPQKQQAGPALPPVSPPVPPPPSSGEMGLPGGMMAPTTEPSTPVNTPLAPPTMAPPPMPPNQQRLALLDQLINSDQTSPQTKAFARTLAQQISGGNSAIR